MTARHALAFSAALLAFVALQPLAALPLRADPVADLVGALDPAIRDVSIAGAFKAEGRQGVYRLVLTRGSGDAPPARLFVQWIAIADDGTTKLERTIEIAEVATEKLRIGRLSADTDQGGLTVFIEIAKPDGDAPASYEAVIEDDGSYRFGPSSN